MNIDNKFVINIKNCLINKALKKWPHLRNHQDEVNSAANMGVAYALKNYDSNKNPSLGSHIMGSGINIMINCFRENGTLLFKRRDRKNPAKFIKKPSILTNRMRIIKELRQKEKQTSYTDVTNWLYNKPTNKDKNYTEIMVREAVSELSSDEVDIVFDRMTRIKGTKLIPLGGIKRKIIREITEFNRNYRKNFE